MLKISVLLFLVVSCSSHKISSGHHSAEYNSRPELNESFLGKSPDNLSDEQIKKLLNSKVKTLNSVRLAVMKLGHSGVDYSFYPQVYRDSQTIDKKNEKFYLALTNESKVDSIAVLPTFLMPKNVTLASLRDSAALLQANYLLILKTNSRSDFDFNVFKADEALAVANLEVALVDVATGVIPYTALITGKKTIKKNKEDDFNSHEFRIRARNEAENEALKNLLSDLITFFGK